MDYRDRHVVLALIGGLLLIVGAGAAVLGPIELYCFYLFGEGGPFYYPGFGFGSFMFGNIAAQIIGYYVIAAIAIPLGYGHLAVRRWARSLALALLWSWLITGVPLSLVFLFVLLTAKELSLLAVLIALGLTGIGYLVVPVALIHFYRSRHTRLTFEARDPTVHWVEQRPLPLLVLSFLYALGVVCLHIPIFYRGIFPFWGVFLFGLPGIVAITASMAILSCLVWGTLNRQMWAWWTALVAVGLMTLSTVITLLRIDYLAVLAEMRFAAIEMEALRGIPVRGMHLAPLLGGPLLVTWVVIARSKRYFGVSGLTGLERSQAQKRIER